MQSKALQFINAHITANRGRWPTFDQVGDAIGVTSKAGVVRTVNALFERNAIQRPGSSP